MGHSGVCAWASIYTGQQTASRHQGTRYLAETHRKNLIAFSRKPRDHAGCPLSSTYPARARREYLRRLPLLCQKIHRWRLATRSNRMGTGHPLPLEDALDILNQIGQGLQFAHDHDLITVISNQPTSFLTAMATRCWPTLGSPCLSERDPSR